MKTLEPFDLEAAVAAWRRRLAARLGGDVLDELESHLRDRVAGLVAGGRAPREAFLEACTRLGHEDLLTSEFGKVRAYAAADRSLAGRASAAYQSVRAALADPVRSLRYE